MKQTKLTRRLYQAMIEKDVEKQCELYQLELAKIFKRKKNGKLFDAKWTVSDF